MKLGIGTYALAWSIGVPGYRPSNSMDVYAFLEFTHRKGISLVQIADNLPLHSFSRQEMAAIKREALASGIDVEVGTRGLTPENMEAYLEIASFFESPLLRVVIDTPDFKPELDEIKKIINNLLPELEKRNIKLAIENHDRLKASDFCQIVENADSDLVGICLDSVNSIGADEGFDTVFETLAPYTINLHLKDYIIQRKPHMMGFDIYGVPAGSGMMPVPKVLNALKSKGKTRSVILELWPPPEKTVQETIEKEQQWVHESIAYLNSLPDLI